MTRVSLPTGRALWERFRTHYCFCPAVELGVDPSRMRFPEGFFRDMDGPIRRALEAMHDLERGAIANPDEKRMVGHYWLRAPERAPSPRIAADIRAALKQVKEFAAGVHAGDVRPQRAARFRHLLLVGIGGSALGPQLVASALGGRRDPLCFHALDNTDPDGFDHTLAEMPLEETLAVVISKSGGTRETRNGMLVSAAAYRKAGLEFARHAAAVTGEGSRLAAEAKGWLASFPMWDWVGGRTSVTSAVGLLPAALQGLDIDGLLAGARAMDEATRADDPLKNPAAVLALLWHHAGNGRGLKDMVVLPYKDRLLLFSRYLQQLVMESLGKETDLDGRIVHQGIAVYGNKGSTDQHAYVQQLRDGLDNHFVTFIEVKEDRLEPARSLEVDPGLTSGDYLGGFLRGTREALTAGGRESITIDLRRFDAAGLGKLIALFERAVGLYASLININAYHQPGVEAGKVAAEEVLKLKLRVLAELGRTRGTTRTAEEVAAALGEGDRVEWVFHLLERLSANPLDSSVRREAGADPFSARYGVG